MAVKLALSALPDPALLAARLSDVHVEAQTFIGDIDGKPTSYPRLLRGEDHTCSSGRHETSVAHLNFMSVPIATCGPVRAVSSIGPAFTQILERTIP